VSARTMYERPVEVRGHWFIKLKSGRLIGYWDAVAAVQAADTAFSTAFSRAVKLAEKEGDSEMRSYYLERAEWLLDSMETYVGSCRAYLEKLRGTQSKRDRIALLRNTDGRTPEEAEAFRRKADELEARLEG
jgi:dihydroorotate dehydrogenase